LETASVLEAVPFYTAELEAAVSTAVKEGAEASHL
jgi:hypothetical protein